MRKTRYICLITLISTLFIYCLSPSLVLAANQASLSNTKSIELIYEDELSKIYSQQSEDGSFTVTQYDNGALTSKVTGNIYDSSKTLKVVYFGSDEKSIKVESVDANSIIKAIDIRSNIQPMYINYSKLGDVHCMKTDGTEFDIGFFFATTAVNQQTIYNPVAGNYIKGVLISAIVSVLAIPFTMGASVLTQVLVALGSAVISGGVATVVSEAPVIAYKTTYAIRLNRYYDSAIVDTTAGYYSFTHKGTTTYMNQGLLPVKDFNTGYQVKNMLFPSGGATFLNWN